MIEMQTVQLARPSAAVAMAAVLATTAPAATYARPFAAHANLIPGGRAIRQTTNQVAWAARREKLNEWSRLSPDWDGEDGVAPSAEVLSNARAFITAAELSALPPPETYVAGDGEVGYFWETQNGFASMSFLPGGDLVGKVRSNGGKTYRYNEPFGTLTDLDKLLLRIAHIV